jgi:HK97 family phage major capsid protein
MSRRKRSHTQEATTPELLHRSVEVERAAIDEDARTVEIAFASEAPVERWFGTEVLSHESAHVRMGRLNNGGALLVEHDRRDQVGVVMRAWVDDDRKGRAIVRFGKSARAEEIFQDVRDGIRRLVSVGYRIHKQETKNEAGGREAVRVVDWEPYELSLVSIPADDSVGVGRGMSEDGPTSERPTNTSDNMNDQDNISNDDAARAAATAPPAQAPATAQRGAQVTNEPAPREDAQDAARRAVEAERTRVAGIQSIAEQAQRQGIRLDVHRAIADGQSVEQVREAAFASLCERRTDYSPGNGLSRGEQRDLSRFSILSGLRNIIQGQPLSGIEAEMHQEAIQEASRSGVNLEGNFHIPGMVLHHGRRDMTATGGSNGDQGGTLVPTVHGSFIELLYARLVLQGLGAQFLSGLTGNLDLPKLVTGSTVANKGETAAADESSPTTGVVQLSPKRATTYVEVSQQLMNQSSPSVEAIVRNDLATALALIIEQRAISGTGDTNQPRGILATVGIGDVAGGTDGAAPTWANIIALETGVATANADIGSLAYLTNPKVRGKLKGTSKVTGENGFIWDGTDTPLNGYRAGVTTQVPSNLTKGAASGTASAIIFGNFSDLVIAQWGGISIMANPYVKDIEGLVRLTVNAYHDNVVRRAASFSAMKDALTV